MIVDVDFKIVNPMLKNKICKATSGSAGYDLHAMIDRKMILDVNECMKIPTGIAIHMKRTDIAAFIFARSGLGVNHGLVPGNCVGVVDSDYTGEIIVAIWNRSGIQQEIIPLERIAQLVFMPVIDVNFNLIEEFSENTMRGSGGFGSTGT